MRLRHVIRLRGTGVPPTVECSTKFLSLAFPTPLLPRDYDRLHLLLPLSLSLLNSYHRRSGAASRCPALQPTCSSNLISANGKFELGFFNPGDASNAYIGIWYHNITDKTALWVLNSVAPVTISPGYLHLTGDGNLELCNAADLVIWFTGTPYGNNTIVRLADSGNFFLEDLDENTTELQSFDYLTDTLIPGMKLGLDKVTNHATKLISWLNASDPYPGAYSCTMETEGTLPEIFITKGQSLRIFRSGPWNGHVFSGIPAMGNISQLKFAFLSNEQEVYFSFDTINNSGLFRAVMDFRGVFQLLEWSATSSGWTSLWAVPQAQCDVYALCGANAVCTETSSVLCQCLQGFVPKSPANWYQNHFSDGCVRQEALSCLSDGFLHLRSVKLPDTVNATTDSNMTLNECSDWCLKNCSCVAYAVTAWSGCLTWPGDLMDLRKFNQGGDQLYIRLLASNLVCLLVLVFWIKWGPFLSSSSSSIFLFLYCLVFFLPLSPSPSSSPSFPSSIAFSSSFHLTASSSSSSFISTGVSCVGALPDGCTTTPWHEIAILDM
ncbi:hypothetical protein BHE74_00037310 [Ensete ventricosum]|nr:hypothetical protein BHE74_00037310 [Ensete ventricosum]